MLAGGGFFFGSPTPAKPRWSEVIIFLDVLLRRGSPCPEENISSNEVGAHRRTVLFKRTIGSRRRNPLKYEKNREVNIVG
jgi:hypothetical protein